MGGLHNAYQFYKESRNAKESIAKQQEQFVLSLLEQDDYKALAAFSTCMTKKDYLGAQRVVEKHQQNTLSELRVNYKG